MSAYNVNAQLSRSPEGWAFGVVRQNIEYGDFTDGGGQYGTLTLRDTIPAGSIVQGVYVDVVTAFNGGTDNLVIGKSSGEDEFTYGTTIDCSSAGIKTEEPEAGERHISTAQTVYLRMDEGSDWGDITSGQMVVEIVYITANQDFSRGYEQRRVF